MRSNNREVLTKKIKFGYLFHSHINNSHKILLSGYYGTAPILPYQKFSKHICLLDLTQSIVIIFIIHIVKTI